MKAAYRDQVERLYRGGADTVGKEHFTSLYSPARARAFIKRNITTAWAATGLFPFNLDRVLRDTPKPPPEVSVLKEVTVGSCPQDEVLDMPVTPVTPVTTKGIESMLDIITHDADALDETSKRRLQRHVHKLASAARYPSPNERKTNNEAKVRRSTKSQVLRTVKVMSYQDLEEARAKRSEKEKAAEDKAKRGRKRKALMSVVDVLESRTQQIQPNEADLAETPAELTREIPGPWRAPVAQMILKN